jgi:starch phosphorylase
VSWWAEAYTPEAGWALGDGREHEDSAWDAIEADALYDRLEREVVPEFYARDDSGFLPRGSSACGRVWRS